MRTHLDALVLGPCLLKKKEQPPMLDSDEWQQAYQLD
jgi:hypothetical protein